MIDSDRRVADNRTSSIRRRSPVGSRANGTMPKPKPLSFGTSYGGSLGFDQTTTQSDQTTLSSLSKQKEQITRMTERAKVELARSRDESKDSTNRKKEEIYSSLDKIRPNTHITLIPLSTPEPTAPLPTTSSSFHSHTDCLTRPNELFGQEVRNNQQIHLSLTPFGNGPMRSPIRERKEGYKPASNETIKRESDRVKRASRMPNAELPKGSAETSWAGYKLAGRVMESKTPNIKNYWEENITKEQIEMESEAKRQRPKSYGFPKWRSSDALSASLVASNPVQIPKDSRIPEQRLKKMEETDREAETAKVLIQQQAEPPRRLNKGKSLDSLIMQTDYQPWYDKQKIRDAVSRESIANMGQARERFETGEFPSQRRERAASSASNRFESIIPPPLPPKSEEIQMRQLSHRNEQQHDYLIDSYQSSPTNGYTQQYRNNQQVSSPRSISHSRESSIQYHYSYEEQLVMLYLKQNPHIVNSLGLNIIESTRMAMEEVPWRKVELRTLDDESQSYTPQTFSPNHRQGRYVKKPQIQANSQTPTRFRKVNDVVPRGIIPENRRQSMQEAEGKQGGSLIAAEIRSNKEREDELRRSRSQLGLPTLEDTMELWKNGQRGIQMNPLRAAISYDHLNHSTIDTPMKKTSSISDMATHDLYSQFDRRNDNNSRDFSSQNVFRQAPFPPSYHLHNTDDQDVMFYGPSRRRENGKRFE